MISFKNSMENGCVDFCSHFVNTCETVETGILVLAEGVSRTAYDLFSLPGFEKMTKSALAHMKLAAFAPRFKGFFEECMKNIEGQKDLLYATMIIDSFPEFVAIDHRTRKYSFQLPRLKEKVNGVEKSSIDIVKILYAIGNVCETGKFFQKYNVLSFPLCTRLATQFGSIKAFSFKGKTYTMKEIPVIGTPFCNTPKDFFIFWASAVEIYRCSKKSVDINNVLKATSSFGKMVLITFGRTHSKKLWFVIVDVITQDSSLIILIWNRHKQRQARFAHPGATAT